MVKLQYISSEHGGRWSITVPKDIVDAKKWKKGQRFAVTFNAEGNVVLHPIEDTEKKE